MCVGVCILYESNCNQHRIVCIEILFVFIIISFDNFLVETSECNKQQRRLGWGGKNINYITLVRDRGVLFLVITLPRNFFFSFFYCNFFSSFARSHSHSRIIIITFLYFIFNNFNQE